METKKLQIRNRNTAKKTSNVCSFCQQEDSASVCSSGYSSEAETEEASIIYYEVI
jgi:hypothetical protein